MDDVEVDDISQEGSSIMPMFPLSSVLFPGAALPLRIFEERYRHLVADTMTGNREFGVVLISRGSEVGGGEERLSIGTLVDIEALSEIEGGQFALLARGIQRIRVHRWLADDPYPRAVIERLPEKLETVTSVHIENSIVSLRRARALLSELHDTPPLPADLKIDTSSPSGLIEAHWMLCTLAPFDAFDRQRLLEAPSAVERLELLGIMCNELAHDVTTMLAQGETE
jgi:hypothetical protein